MSKQSSSSGLLLLRVDVSVRKGTGHFMRCLALAQAWQAHGDRAIFAFSLRGNEVLIERLRRDGIGFVDLAPNASIHDQVALIENAVTTTWPSGSAGEVFVAYDGVELDSDLALLLQKRGFSRIIIDDTAQAPYYPADILINQNAHAPNLNYKCPAECIKLLGPEYVMLRREYWRWRGKTRHIPRMASKVLVTMGGADPDNMMLKVIKAIKGVGLEPLEVRVIVGPLNPHRESLLAELKGSMNIQLLSNVDNMSEQLAWADMAVSSAGTTTWELAFMGVPAVIGCIAPVESTLLDGLAGKEIFKRIGWYAHRTTSQIADSIMRVASDYSWRQRSSRNGQQLVDGLGVERIVAVCHNMISRKLEVRQHG